MPSSPENEAVVDYGVQSAEERLETSRGDEVPMPPLVTEPEFVELDDDFVIIEPVRIDYEQNDE